MSPLATFTSWYPLQGGVAGTKDTLSVMRRQVTDCVTDPMQITRGCCLAILDQVGARGGDRVAEARALFDWIVANVTFRRDPWGTDLCQSPLVLLAQSEARALSGGKSTKPAGDCNNQAALFAALGFTVSLPLVWVLIGRSPQEYEHIYPAMELGEPGQDDEDHLLALDTATSVPTFGVPSSFGAGGDRWVVPAINDY